MQEQLSRGRRNKLKKASCNIKNKLHQSWIPINHLQEGDYLEFIGNTRLIIKRNSLKKSFCLKLDIMLIPEPNFG